MWNEYKMKTGRDQMFRKWREKEVRKTENVMGGLCLERSGKSGRRMENNSKRKSWRLAIENVVIEK